MLIDCEKCELRNVGCADCVVPAMIAAPRTKIEIGEVEERALRILADGGMIPPLRMMISVERAS